MLLKEDNNRFEATTDSGLSRSSDPFKKAFYGPFFRGWATIPPERFGRAHRRFYAPKPRLFRPKNSPCPITDQAGIFVMLCVLRRKRRAYDIRGFEFALRVQVGIDIARCTYI